MTELPSLCATVFTEMINRVLRGALVKVLLVNYMYSGALLDAKILISKCKLPNFYQ